MSAADAFVDAYVEAIREENAAIFAGAGLSIPAGLVDWRGLLRDVAKDIGLDVDQETDLVSVAQFHVNERGGRHRINQALVTEFAERAKLTDNHRLLASLPIHTYWTTNYDTLLEQALREAKKRPDVKSEEANLAVTLPRRDAVIYKMHGDVSQPDRAVVTRDDYEAYHETHRLFTAALQGDLVSKTLLFIGFSFSDPNLSYIFGRIRVLLRENRRQHFSLMRRVHRGDFETNAAFDYAKARQELQVRDLRRYGIQEVLVEDFSEYTQIIRRLTDRYRRTRVFVSGSGTAFDPWSMEEAEGFVRDLGRKLIEAGFDLVSGFGLGVGSPLLNGILDGLEREGSYSLHDKLVLRPFPQGERDAAVRATRWTAYRREMLSHAGIAVFLFGNRRGVDGKIELAAGVEEEFNLATEAGLVVLPVGATGSMAARLHERVLREFEKFYPGRSDLRPALEALGEGTDKAVLAQKVVEFIARLR